MSPIRIDLFHAGQWVHVEGKSASMLTSFCHLAATTPEEWTKSPQSGGKNSRNGQHQQQYCHDPRPAQKVHA